MHRSWSEDSKLCTQFEEVRTEDEEVRTEDLPCAQQTLQCGIFIFKENSHIMPQFVDIDSHGLNMRAFSPVVLLFHTCSTYIVQYIALTK